MAHHIRIAARRSAIAAAFGATTCLGGLLLASSCSEAPSTSPSGTSPSAPSVEASPESASRADRPVPPPYDAGSRRDTGIDVELDYDANAWDGSVPFSGVWDPIPGLPASFAARLARDPATSIPPLPWRACSSGRAGCQIFTQDWSFSYTFAFRPFPTTPFFEDANGVHIAYLRGIRAEPERSFAVVQKLHGDAELAIYTDSGGNGTIAEASGHADGVYVLIGKKLALYETFIGKASPGDASAFPVDRATLLLGRNNLIQGSAAGRGFLALEQTSLGLGIFTSAYQAPDASLAQVTPNDSLQTERPVTVTGGYLALVATEPYYVAFMPLAGGYRPLVQPLPGNRIVWVGVDRANQDAIYWVEKGASRTLWGSSFADVSAGIVRRQIAVVPESSYRPVVNGGIAVFARDNDSLRAVRTSDGLGWNVTGEAGTPMLYGLWANDDSIWAGVSNIPFGSPGFPTLGGMLRVPCATLGPPTVPSGL